MRENLTNSANQALKAVVIGPELSEGFKALFIQKMGSLANENGVADASLHAYLVHSSKLNSVSAYVDADRKVPNDFLLTTLCKNVLSSLMKNNAVDTEIDLDDENDDASNVKTVVNKMDGALNDEFAKMGALQSVRHSVADTSAEVTNSSHIIENYILGGRTNVTDVPDNFVMTPVGRVAKLMYYIMPSNNGMTSAYVAINYVFFAAMFCYVLQLPALALYRLYKQKKGQAEKKPLLDKFEIVFGIFGISITALVGAATFMTVFHPFVIAVFSIAVVAHSMNLVLLGINRRKTRKNYEDSLAQIETSRQNIEMLKKQRANYYAELAACKKNNDQRAVDEKISEIQQKNSEIYEATQKLQTVVAAHHQIRLDHEQAHNRTRLKISVAAVVVAVCVLTFFILSSPICPPTLIPALAILAVLGMIGAGLVLTKSVNQYNREKKSKRANEVEVDIALENECDLTDEAQHDVTVANDFDMERVVDNQPALEQQRLIEEPAANNAPNEKLSISTDNLVKLSDHSSGLFSRKTKEGRQEKIEQRVPGLMWNRKKQTRHVIKEAKEQCRLQASQRM